LAYIETFFLGFISYQLYRINKNIKAKNILYQIKRHHFSYTMTDNIANLIHEDHYRFRTYFHYTPKESNAEKICSQGFKYINSFYKTAEEIDNDWSYDAFLHYRQRYFGDFIMVIKIPKECTKWREELINEIGIKNWPPTENILSDILLTEDNELNHLNYILPCRFIKGFFNYKTGQLFDNPNFDPHLTKEDLRERIKRLTLN